METAARTVSTVTWIHPWEVRVERVLGRWLIATPVDGVPRMYYCGSLVIPESWEPWVQHWFQSQLRAGDRVTLVLLGEQSDGTLIVDPRTSESLSCGAIARGYAAPGVLMWQHPQMRETALTALQQAYHQRAGYWREREASTTALKIPEDIARNLVLPEDAGISWWGIMCALLILGALAWRDRQFQGQSTAHTGTLKRALGYMVGAYSQAGYSAPSSMPTMPLSRDALLSPREHALRHAANHAADSASTKK